MDIPMFFKILFSRLLQFLRSNAHFRLLRQVPSLLLKILRLAVLKRPARTRPDHQYKPTKKAEPSDPESKYGRSSNPITSASYMPQGPPLGPHSKTYLPNAASPRSQSPHTLQSSTRTGSFVSVNSAFSQASGSQPPLDSRVVSFDGGPSARVPHASSSRLSLDSVHSSVHSTAHSAFNGDRAPIRQSTIHPQIDCMLSTELSRYLRKHKIQQEQPNVTIHALETKYACPIPEGWTKYVNPDGCPYWYDTKRKVLTDVNLLDKDILYQTHLFVDIIFDYIRAENLQLEPDAELVVETLKYDWDEDYRCMYYFVHHNSRSLFWLQDFDVSYALWDAHTNTSLSHVKLEIEAPYWQNWELFCNIQVVTEEVHDELTNILIVDLIGLQTSDTPNALFSANELQSYLQAIESSRRLINAPSKGSPFLIGRLMSMYMRQRFANFWGEYGARLYSAQSLRHPEGLRQTRFISLMSPCLFNAPDVHLRRLNAIYIDDSVAIQAWRVLITHLHAEWQDFIINSAVLLAANVAFLAIQSVDGNRDDPYRSPSQIASYLSTLTSVSSMIVGLLLVRHTRTQNRDSHRDAAEYLRGRSYRVVGLEPLAIIYSLPYAFLMWAVIFFMIAFLLVCLSETTLITRVLTGTVGLICVLFIAWCVCMNWDYGPDLHEPRWNTFIDTLSQWSARLHETLQSLAFMLRRHAQSHPNIQST